MTTRRRKTPEPTVHTRRRKQQRSYPDITNHGTTIVETETVWDWWITVDPDSDGPHDPAAISGGTGTTKKDAEAQAAERLARGVS